jgi:trehalose 6-phosphate phosphatase
MSAAVELLAAIDALAAAPRLLVASDYDGTLADIVDDPRRAVPHQRAVRALEGLARTSDTVVAVVSGRSLDDLVTTSGLPGTVHLVGSHGAELDDATSTLTGDERSRLAEVMAAVHGVAATVPGALVEPKPFGVAFHTRRVPLVTARVATEQVVAELSRRAGVWTRRGKAVVEFAVRDADKGSALEWLRRQHLPDAVLFVGDDVTDEQAFEVLGSGDVGVKVGEGATAANLRVADPSAVADLLERLLRARTAHVDSIAARNR